MKIKSLIISLFLALTLSACERNPDITSPKQYEKQGISFSYPGNWEITDDGKNGNVHYIIISSTGDSLFMIHTFITAEAPDLKAFAESMSSNIASEMPFGEMKTDSLTSIKKADKNTWIKEMLSVTLLGQNVPYLREYRRIKKPKIEAFLTSQASVESQAKVEPGFKLIYQSFILEE